MDVSSWIADPKTITTIVAGAAGWASALIALFNAKTTRRQLRISEAQEGRHSVGLKPYLVQGLCEVHEDRRVHIFALVIRNPADDANSLAYAELQINYWNKEGIRLTAKIPHSAESQTASVKLDRNRALIPPVPINPRGTVNGSIVFEISNKILEPMTIDDYRVVLEDTLGNASVVTAILLREIIQESGSK